MKKKSDEANVQRPLVKSKVEHLFLGIRELNPIIAVCSILSISLKKSNILFLKRIKPKTIKKSEITVEMACEKF
ncbi:MAG: hypothetical protein HRT67_01260 [Flavobacteriaceae bacterium]|nr:hypothetical protein [Flavobacteriaceae bacterium]